MDGKLCVKLVGLVGMVNPVCERGVFVTWQLDEGLVVGPRRHTESNLCLTELEIAT